MHVRMLKGNSLWIATGMISFALLAVIISLQRYYYDDEYFNLGILTNPSLPGIIKYINHNDVHPPLSYIINYFFHSDNILIAALPAILLNIVALSFFFKNITAHQVSNDRLSLSIFWIGVFINANILMWCLGLRWYSYWVPFFIILYVELIVKKQFNFPIVVIITTLLIYTSYLSFVTLPVLFVFSYIKNRKSITLSRYIAAAAIVFILSLYQLVVFFEVHYHGSASQVSGYSASLASILVTTLLGNAIFPLEWTGVLYFTAVILFAVCFIVFNRKKLTGDLLITILLFLSFILILTATGLGGKLRNSVFLGIIFIHVLYLASLQMSRPFKIIILSSLTLLTCHSVFNLVSRTNTSKNSVNLPLGELSKILKKEKAGFVIYTFDPGIAYTCIKQGFAVISFYNITGCVADSVFALTKGQKIYIANTYRAGIDFPVFDKIQKVYTEIVETNKNVATYHLGFDKWYKEKRKIEGNLPAKYTLPEYLITLNELEVTTAQKLPVITENTVHGNPF